MRHKYVCFDCRRIFKCVEYRTADYVRGNPVLVRPVSAGLRASRNALRRLYLESKATGDTEKWDYITQKGSHHFQALMRGDKGLSEEEIEELKHLTPEVWWQRMGPCCPGCGEDGRKVGTSFEAPSRDNVGAWKKLRVWIEGGGEQMERASFDLEVLKEKERQRFSLEYEKRRRIDTLQQAMVLGVRTSEEEERLAIIRLLKGKVVDEAWGVVV